MPKFIWHPGMTWIFLKKSTVNDSGVFIVNFDHISHPFLPFLLLTLNKWMSLQKKKKFSIKDFFGKCDQIRSFLRIWLHLLKKSLMKIFIFCAVC